MSNPKPAGFIEALYLIVCVLMICSLGGHAYLKQWIYVLTGATSTVNQIVFFGLVFVVSLFATALHHSVMNRRDQRIKFAARQEVLAELYEKQKSAIQFRPIVEDSTPTEPSASLEQLCEDKVCSTTEDLDSLAASFKRAGIE